MAHVSLKQSVRKQPTFLKKWKLKYIYIYIALAAGWCSSPSCHAAICGVSASICRCTADVSDTLVFLFWSLAASSFPATELQGCSSASPGGSCSSCVHSSGSSGSWFWVLLDLHALRGEWNGAFLGFHSRIHAVDSDPVSAAKFCNINDTLFRTLESSMILYSLMSLYWSLESGTLSKTMTASGKKTMEKSHSSVNLSSFWEP